MLKHLSIENYLLIGSLELDFPKGLIIITGETGAGKSVLLGALQLLLGGKAESGMIKERDKNCIVEGLFQFEMPIEVKWQDGSTTQESELIIRRVLSASGRSRAFVNDEPATQQMLLELSGKMVDVHTQHQQLLLGNEAFQMSILDNFAGSVQLLEQYRALHNSYKNALQRLKEAESKARNSISENEYKSFVLERLIEANLQEGELAAIEQEQKELANAEEIKSALYRAAALMESEEFSINRNLREAAAGISKLTGYIPALGQLAERIESCRIECKDIAEELESNAERVEINPQRLEAVEERIGQIYDLLHKYDCSGEAQLIAYREELRSQLAEREAGEEEIARMRLEAEELSKAERQKAKELGEARQKAIMRLSEELQAMVRSLGMPKALFQAKLSALAELGENGGESIAFLFSANGSPAPGALAKVASGGELSRIMLCLKALLAQYTGMPTLIFDEIDTGVSGSVAEKMGRMIDRMGQMMQVIAITHLPQIASKGEMHLLVYKENLPDGAKTGIRTLKSEERVLEIARMLSGEELTPAAIENAKELLGTKQTKEIDDNKQTI